MAAYSKVVDLIDKIFECVNKESLAKVPAVTAADRLGINVDALKLDVKTREKNQSREKKLAKGNKLLFHFKIFAQSLV